MDYSKGNSLSEHYSWRGSNYCSRSNSNKRCNCTCSCCWKSC